MQESYMKSIASYHSSESCLDDPQGSGEALTGESTGAVLSSEITLTRRQTPLDEGESDIEAYRKGEVWLASAESETCSMCGHSLHENRETRQAPSPKVNGKRVVSMKERTRRIDADRTGSRTVS